MILTALRDLQWRRRRVLIAVAGTALVCAMTLLVTGISAGFDAEARRTVGQFGVDGWYVRSGSSGPFLGASPLPAASAAAVAAVPGVSDVGAIVYSRKAVPVGGTTEDVNIFGAEPDGPGMPLASRGRAPAASGEALISAELAGYDVGDTIAVAGQPFKVVGEIDRSTALAGTPNVFLTLGDAQAVAYAGQPIAAAFAVTGKPTGPAPDGLVAVTNAEATADLLRALEQARSTISLVAVLLWLVAATIIGSVIYLSALERQRDVAVFKATGVATGPILAGMALQAAVLSVAAAVAGSAIATVLGPRFPMLVSIEASAHLLLPVIAVAIGLAASVGGLRRVAAVDPAIAFRGA